MKRLNIAIAALALLCPSCSYMQSHKNVEEMGRVYEGSRLEKNGIALYSAGGNWYLAAPAAKFRKSYPLFHDSVLLTENNEPEFKKVQGTLQYSTFYFRISEGTAACLQRTDGYANLEDLAQEIRSSTAKPLSSLPGGVRHAIVAHLQAPKNAVTLVNEPTTTPSMATKMLSKADFVLLDIPGTVAYNVAIPFMAPFVFFREFTNEENEFH